MADSPMSSTSGSGVSPFAYLRFIKFEIFDSIRKVVMYCRLLCVLLGWLGHGFWIWMLVRLLFYIMVTISVYVYCFFLYFMNSGSSTVRRNISYGTHHRNILDIYVPSKTFERPLRTLIFIPGGAWTIGNKLWGIHLGLSMAARGVLTIIPDYRNFPQATASGMESDVSRALAWSLANCRRFGGDPSQVLVSGHSAGAHLAALAIVRSIRFHSADTPSACKGAHASPPPPKGARYLSRCTGTPQDPTISEWDVDGQRFAAAASAQSLLCCLCGCLSPCAAGRLAGVVLVSGAYDPPMLECHFECRGLNSQLQRALFEDAPESFSLPLLLGERPRHLGGRRSRKDVALSPPGAGSSRKSSSSSSSASIPAYSSDVLSPLRGPNVPNTKRVISPCDGRRVPPFLLLHGSTDITVPATSSLEFAESLSNAHFDVRCVVLGAKSHTDLVIEGPIGGDTILYDTLYICAVQSISAASRFFTPRTVQDRKASPDSLAIGAMRAMRLRKHALLLQRQQRHARSSPNSTDMSDCSSDSLESEPQDEDALRRSFTPWNSIVDIGADSPPPLSFSAFRSSISLASRNSQQRRPAYRYLPDIEDDLVIEQNHVDS